MTISKQIFADNVRTTVQGGISSIATTIPVANGAIFPVPSVGQYFEVTLVSGPTIEVIKVQGVSGNNLTNCVRAQSGHVASNFPDGTIVEMRLSANALSTFAKLNQRMDELALIDLLVPPNQSNSNSYICHNSDENHNNILAIATPANTWSFPSHDIIVTQGSVGAVLSTSMTNPFITGKLGTFLPGQYILQFTSGSAQGVVRSITSCVGSTVNWITPIDNNITAGSMNSGDTFVIYGSQAAVISSFLSSNQGSTNLGSLLNKSGGTMTGPLTLYGNPIQALDAVPKQYVDSEISQIGDLVRQPSCVSPANTATVGTHVTLTGSTYYSLYGVAAATSRFQVATDAAFTNLVYDSSTISFTQSITTPSNLATGQIFYWRLAYGDAEGKSSKWSNPFQFTTGNVTISKPSITSPVNGATGVGVYQPTFVGSAFSVTGGSDTQASADWQITTDATFNTIDVIDTGAYSTSLTTYQAPFSLAYNKTYYIRVKYNSSNYGSSPWSDAISITTTVGSVNTPSITTPAQNATGVAPGSTLSGTPFSVTGVTDTIKNSTWVITRASDSASQTFVSPNSTNLVLPAVVANGLIQYDNTYTVVLSYTGNILPVSGTTSVTFSTPVSTPGTPTIVGLKAGETSVTPGETVTQQSNGGSYTFSTSFFSPNPNVPTDNTTAVEWQVFAGSGTSGSIVLDFTDTVGNATYSFPSSGTSNDALPLQAGSTYTLRARHKGAYSWSNWSASVTFAVTAASADTIMTDPTKTYTWTNPGGVTSICLVAVSGGAQGCGLPGDTRGMGGAGGGLAWANNIKVTNTTIIKVAPMINNNIYNPFSPGTAPGFKIGNGWQITISDDLTAGVPTSAQSPWYGTNIYVVGAIPPSALSGNIVQGSFPGSATFILGSNFTTPPVEGTDYFRSQGGAGGLTTNAFLGDGTTPCYGLGGGGGAAGYDNGPLTGTNVSTGGAGGALFGMSTTGNAGSHGYGGGGGGGGSGMPNDTSSAGGAGGGGVGLYGIATTNVGTNGSGAGGNGAGFSTVASPGQGGGYSGVAGTSGSADPGGGGVYAGGNGGGYGGGGGQTANLSAGLGGAGAVRIIWGPGRSFPYNAQ